MATFKITSLNSPVPSTDFAFWNDGTDLTNALTLDGSGFLISRQQLIGITLMPGREAISVGSRSWTMALNGVVLATTPGKSAVYLWNESATSLSSITVGAEGEVSGTNGILSRHRANIVNKGEIRAADDPNSAAIGFFGTADGDNKIENSGLIESTAFGIRYSEEVAGTHTIINKGTIKATSAIMVDVETSTSIEKVTNSGLIDGMVGLAGGNDTLINTGEITGGVHLRLGADVLQNSGTIGDDVYLGTPNHEAENDTLINTGTIDGTVFLEGGADSVTNGGTLKSINFTDGGDTFVNSGVLLSDLIFPGGKINNSGTFKGTLTTYQAVEITNTGKIEGLITLGDAGNTLTNSGALSGYLNGGDGDDIVKSTGTINGIVTLGAGDDYFSGGNGRDIVRNGDGADTYLLGGGDDWYSAYAFSGAGGEATDYIDAGAGIDSYDVDEGTFASLFINIDTMAHTYAGQTTIAATTAYGAAVSGDATGVTSKDTVKGFESVYGSDQADTVYGNSAANVMWGRAGHDYLIGFGGSDQLRGDEGDDHLSGGLGADGLTGGSGADVFHYDTVKDSGITKATRDTIMDFESGVDRIDLSLLDANSVLAGPQQFNWLGTNANFTQHAGDLRAYWTTTGQMLEADFTGDGKADFSVHLAGFSGTLGINDFIFAPLP